MTTPIITREEIEKLARLSCIELSESEIDSMQQHVTAVLAYAARVQEIAKDVHIDSFKNNNIEREDVIIATNAQNILAQAPEREGDFFVVPAIIESN
jgi:aspartyl-tRNA(Asn)/glutamyl-tRNA(Gln) amidotransferase subunit C